MTLLPNERMNALFDATVQATEEAILNALVAAETMTGIDDHKVIALPHGRVKEILKKHNPKTRIVAVEPASSPVLSGGEPGFHKIQGIGAGFIPENLDTSIYDEVIRVSDDDAAQFTRRLARDEGILAGLSR